MKYRKRGFFQRIVYAVGLMVSVGFIALVSITCVGIKIKAEKEGITFRQACAKLFLGEPKQPVETYSGDRPTLPSLEEVAKKQAANSHPAAPRQLTPGNGTAHPAAPAAYSAPSKKQTTANGDEAGVCESCKRFHLKRVSCADDAAFASTLLKEPAKPKYKQPATQTKKSKKTVSDTTLKPKDFVSAVTWQAADNTPGVGRTVGANKYGNINEVSDLERQAAQNVGNLKSLKELQDATAAVRGGN